jgi:hypothetical protein
MCNSTEPMNDAHEKFDHALADMVEREERTEWFERHLNRRRIVPSNPDQCGGTLLFYRAANAVLVILIALGLYLLGQFDGMAAGRAEQTERTDQPKERTP